MADPRVRGPTGGRARGLAGPRAAGPADWWAHGLAGPWAGEPAGWRARGLVCTRVEVGPRVGRGGRGPEWAGLD